MDGSLYKGQPFQLSSNISLNLNHIVYFYDTLNKDLETYNNYPDSTDIPPTPKPLVIQHGFENTDSPYV